MVPRPPLSACLLGVAVAACGLDGGTLYRCEVDGGCFQPGHVCRADPGGARYCVPAGLLWPDGSAMTDGPVLPDASVMPDASVDPGPCACRPIDGCGYVTLPGCGEVFCDYCPAGEHCLANNVCAPTLLCEDGGWCWENPVPVGADLRGFHRHGPRRVYLVGDGATVLMFDGEQVQLMPVPVRDTTLTAVHGAGDDVYAVGTRGVVLHLVDGGWVQESTLTPEALASVHVLGSGLAFAVGDNATLLRRAPGPCPPAGPCWVQVGTSAPLTADFAAVAGDEVSGEVRALVRFTGEVYTLRGNGFEREVSLSNFSGRDLRLVRPGLWAAVGRAGGNTQLLLTEDGGFDGPVQRRTTQGTLVALAPGAEGDDAVYGVGTEGALVRLPLDGGDERRLPSGYTQELLTVGVLGPGHVMTAGSDGVWAACRPPCTAATDMRKLTRGDFRRITQLCGVSEEAVIGAAQETCENRNNGTCSVRTFHRDVQPSVRWPFQDLTMPGVRGSGAPQPTAGCTASALAGRAWHMTTRGNLVEHDFASGVTSFDGGRVGVADAGLLGLWTSDGDEVWLLSPSTLYQARLRNVPPTLANAFAPGAVVRALWGATRPSLRVYVVGDDGYAVQRNADGGPALDITRPTDGSLRALSAAGQLDGGVLWVAAGLGGTVWRRTVALVFSPEDVVGLEEDVTAVAVGASGRAFLLLPGARLLTGVPYSGGWRAEQLPLTEDLDSVLAVRGRDGGTVLFVAGQGGRILRKALALPGPTPP